MAREKKRAGPPAKKARVEVKRKESVVDKGKGKRRDDENHNDDDDDDKELHDAPSTRHDLPKSFKVVAGSYEKLLYGLHGTVSPASSSSVSSSSSSSSSTTLTPEQRPYTIALSPIFIFPAHVSCIKAVAASPAGGKWLATGSADEIIKVWDLRRRKEVGGLMHHEGSITHLVFPSRSHLLSASEDGTLCLFRARDWSVLRALKGHKGRVNCVAVHPTGKLALSVGKDRALRMWDLMRGRGSASTKLGKEGEIVRWSTDGALFAVQTGSTITIYTTSMEILHTINHPSRLHDIHFCRRAIGKGELLLAPAEDKLVRIYSISTDPQTPPKPIAALTGHLNRVKAVQTLDIALPAPVAGREATTIACTVSSDGLVHVYDLAMVPAPAPAPGADEEVVEIAPVAVYDTKGTRLTCLTLADGDAVGAEAQAGEKRKEPTDEDEDEVQAAEEWPSEQEEEESE